MQSSHVDFCQTHSGNKRIVVEGVGEKDTRPKRFGNRKKHPAPAFEKSAGDENM